MSPRYGLQGDRSRDFLTYGGRILWHDNADELAWLIPHGATVREIPRDIPDTQCLHIRYHPAMPPDLSWPLRREEFRTR